jgi:hypothetical protein
MRRNFLQHSFKTRPRVQDAGLRDPIVNGCAATSAFSDRHQAINVRVRRFQDPRLPLLVLTAGFPGQTTRYHGIQPGLRGSLFDTPGNFKAISRASAAVAGAFGATPGAQWMKAEVRP